MRNLISSLSSGKAPVSYSPNGRLSTALVSTYNIRTQLEQMRRNPTVFAVVNTLSRGVAKAQWQLWRSAASGKPEDRVQVTSHAALNLLGDPNKFFTPHRLVRSGEQHQLLTGRTYFVVQRSPVMRSMPIGLWPMRPDRVTPVPDTTSFLGGWIYTGPNGERVPLAVDEVLSIVTPDPMDPYGGISPVASLLPTLDATRFAQEYTRNFYINDASPGGIIQAPTQLSDLQFDQFQKRWTETHKGVDKAHRIAILENGMQWTAVGANQRDMQFVEQRQDNRDEITEAWAFPKSMLGASDDVNRAIAEANRATFAEQLIVPELDAWKDMYNHDYLPLFGATAGGLEFDYVNPVPEDKLLQAQVNQAVSYALKLAIDAGVDAHDVMEWLGLPKMGYNAPVMPTPTSLPPGTTPPDGGPAEAKPPRQPWEDDGPGARNASRRVLTNGHRVSWGAL